jgi:hypothetical protein
MLPDLTIGGLRMRVREIEKAQALKEPHDGVDTTVAYALIQIAQEMNEIKTLLEAIHAKL